MNPKEEKLSEIEVKERDKTGKGEAKRLRAKGMVPGIIYNKNGKSIPFYLSLIEFKKAIKTKWKMNTLFKLKSNGSGQLNGKIAIIKDYQIDRITDNLLHIDLYEVSPGEPIKIQVPLTLTGTPSGVKKGGVLEWIKRKVNIKCLPENIPDTITINVSELEIGNSLHLSDLKVEEGIEILDDKNLPIVTIVAPYEEKTEVAPAAATAEEVASAEGEKLEEKEEKKEEKETTE